MFSLESLRSSRALFGSSTGKSVSISAVIDGQLRMTSALEQNAARINHLAAFSEAVENLITIHASIKDCGLTGALAHTVRPSLEGIGIKFARVENKNNAVVGAQLLASIKAELEQAETQIQDIFAEIVKNFDSFVGELASGSKSQIEAIQGLLGSFKVDDAEGFAAKEITGYSKDVFNQKLGALQAVMPLVEASVNDVGLANADEYAAHLPILGVSVANKAIVDGGEVPAMEKSTVGGLGWTAEDVTTAANGVVSVMGFADKVGALGETFKGKISSGEGDEEGRRVYAEFVNKLVAVFYQNAKELAGQAIALLDIGQPAGEHSEPDGDEGAGAEPPPAAEPTSEPTSEPTEDGKGDTAPVARRGFAGLKAITSSK